MIEMVEDDAHVDRLLPILDGVLIGGALITIERARVLRCAARGSVRPAASGGS